MYATNSESGLSGQERSHRICMKSFAPIIRRITRTKSGNRHHEDARGGDGDDYDGCGIHGSMKSDGLTAVPRWRTACLMRGYKLVSHAEQVPQDIGRDAGQANQHGAVVEIVVGNVVDIGSRCEQFGAVVEVNPNRKRTRLSRTINWRTCQKFSVKP